MLEVYSPAPAAGPLHQGEILSEVVELRVELRALDAQTGEIDVSERVHPMALVLTQGCDLDWDFQFRSIPIDEHERRQKLAHKELPNILLCELWNARDLKGHHDLNSRLWHPIVQNKDERYHFLPKPTTSQDAQGAGFEDDLAIDFKRVFTVGAQELYFRLEQEVKRRCCLNGPFMQHLSNRFGYYQLRVALPEMVAESPEDPQIRNTQTST